MRYTVIFLAALALPVAAQAAGPKPDSFLGRILAAENAERASLHLPSLKWDKNLTFEAGVWANHLADTGQPKHATGADNPHDEGETLWVGTAGAYTPEEMVGGWLAEKRNFRDGVFPDISKTGNVADAGHYSQVVWRNTTRIGCLKASGHGMDFLVCRYSPAGNVPGQKPY